MSELMERGVLAGTSYDRSTIHEDLQSLADAVLQQQATKRDFIVDTRTMTFRTANGKSDLSWDVPEQADVPAGIEGGPVTDFAHGQLSDKLGIPRKYYKRMQQEHPELLDRNVEGWLHRNEERRMVRMLNGRVRAFLSDRYRRLDNIDLMEQAVLPSLATIDGLHFQVASLTPERLQINALLPGLADEVKKDDVVQAGITIRNSEVGEGRLYVAPRVWRLACLNGLLIDAMALARYHVGRQADEEVYALFADDTLAADDQAYFLKVRDMIQAALSEATFQTIVAQLRAAADPDAAIENPVAAAERLADRYDLNDGEQASFLKHLAAGGDLTRWGAINALTAAAKDSDTFERGAELETAGGRLVGATAKEWQAVCAA